MGFLGTPPVVAGKLDENGLASYVADANTAQKAGAGAIAFFKDSSDRWSAVKYYRAAATVAQGASLAKDTGSRDPNFLITAPTTAQGQNRCKGFAAAAVSNTGYWSWAYIAGYCPNLPFNSGYASNQLFGLSATTAGKLSSHGFNTGPATGLATSLNYGFVWSLGSESSAAAATDVFALNSGVILGWLQ